MIGFIIMFEKKRMNWGNEVSSESGEFFYDDGYYLNGNFGYWRRFKWVISVRLMLDFLF